MVLNKNILVGLLLSGSMLCSLSGQAGNEDRAGSAGSTELNINPWARSAGWGMAGMSSMNGLESMFSNMAGLAYTKGTEIAFCRSNWLGQASGIGLNAFGFAQKLGETGALGISLSSFNYGDIQITTTELPEGGLGTYSPSSMNIALGYAKKFSPTISGGLSVKVISTQMTNVRTQGVALDAGIRYVTGENEQIKFGISLRNVGPPMSFKGDGLAIEMQNLDTELLLTTEQRAASYELPSQLNIGASYDFIFSEKSTLVAALTYTSNSFTRDQWRLGVEYKLKSEKVHFILRGGYVYESDIFSADNRATALTGPAGGLSVDFPVGENGTAIGLDYAVRTSALGFIHTVGAKINIGGGE
ncbi:PorV/PorQ family protein [Parvicella tangerina]|uniref:PorV/PorQ family protein n=1 Tax=Parvicella tangerina TaxID=2829795 RepID=A0A916JPQ1_9FLAO|nr:PorV/PorQ family protein [Parvicella tangerina]CAG5085356.1 hypothetical protein CRYO30217_02736 [Parvicella tangerina]